MKYSFDVKRAKEGAIEWIKKTANADGFNKVVIGISGGKDSTIAAALCCKALGKENVQGLLLPNGIQSDFNDSIEVCKSLGIKHETFNIKPIYDTYIMQYVMCQIERKQYDMVNNTEGLMLLMNKSEINENKQIMPSKDALINLAPRIRMSMLRLWGQSHHQRLCGTGNLSEITVGYCTKDGDTSCDFNPLGGLTSIEVVEIGRIMDEIPERLVIKTPHDGLSDKSDEEKIGISYENIHKYIRNMEMNTSVWQSINKLELAGLHKRTQNKVYIPQQDILYTDI